VIPWKPATTAIFPSLSACFKRSPVIFSIRAFVWTLSEMIPACLPVNDCALWPSD
jgi:hypothetical protein